MIFKTIVELSEMSSLELTNYLNELLNERIKLAYLSNDVVISIDRTLFTQREINRKDRK